MPKQEKDKKQRLVKIIKNRSYREGEFTLASGKKSKFYLDLKETTLNQEGIALIADLICDLIENKKLKIYAVGGMTLGADPLATATILEAYKRNIPLHSFIVRKQPKKHGTLAWIEGAQSFPKNAQLLLLEDVVTTGGSALLAYEKLLEAGFKVAAIISIVDRQEGAKEVFKQKNIHFFSLCTLPEIVQENKT